MPFDRATRPDVHGDNAGRSSPSPSRQRRCRSRSIERCRKLLTGADTERYARTRRPLRILLRMRRRGAEHSGALGARDATLPPASALAADRVRRSWRWDCSSPRRPPSAWLPRRADQRIRRSTRTEARGDAKRARHRRRRQRAPTTTTLPPYTGWVDPASVYQPFAGATVQGLLTFRGNPTRNYYGKGPVPTGAKGRPGSTRATRCARCRRTRARPRTGAATDGPASPRCSSATAVPGSCSARTTAPCTWSTASPAPTSSRRSSPATSSRAR